MARQKSGSTGVNVKLSFQVIKEYFDALPFDALPSNEKTNSLKKKRERAEAALSHLNYFFNSRVGDVLTLKPCGPRPQIPDLP